MRPVELATPQAALSAPRAEDAEAIHRICQDPQIQRYTALPIPYRRAHAEQFVRRATAGWSYGSAATWAVRRETELCGMISLDEIGEGTARVGFWLAPDHRGRGLMTEALHAACAWSFAAPLRLDRVEWRAVVGNVASARVARNVGFRYAGVLRSALITSAGTRADAWVADLLPHDLPHDGPGAAPRWPVLD